MGHILMCKKIETQETKGMTIMSGLWWRPKSPLESRARKDKEKNILVTNNEFKQKSVHLEASSFTTLSSVGKDKVFLLKKG